MNKKDHMARFITCLLPCSLIMTALPVRAQDPAEPNVQIIQSDSDSQPIEQPDTKPVCEQPDPAPAEAPDSSTVQDPASKPEETHSTPPEETNSSALDDSSQSPDEKQIEDDKQVSSSQPSTVPSALQSEDTVTSAQPAHPAAIDQSDPEEPAKEPVEEPAMSKDTETEASVKEDVQMIDIAAFLATIAAPEAGQPLQTTVTPVEGMGGSFSARWYEGDSFSTLPQGTVAGFNTVYRIYISFTKSTGWEADTSSLPDGWTEGNSGGSFVILKKTFPATRKERITVTSAPADLTLKRKYASFNSLVTQNSDLVTYSYAYKESTNEEILINYSYTCEDYSSDNGMINTALWKAEVDSQYEIDLSEFELSIPQTGSITITNLPLLDPQLEAWDSYAVYCDVPLNITGSLLNPNNVPLSYYLIEDDGTERLLNRGLFSPECAGVYTIEIRSAKTDTYYASSVQKHLTIQKADVTSLISASKADWIYGQQPSATQVEFNPGNGIYSFDLSDLIEGKAINTDTGESYEMTDTLPSGHYKGSVSLPESNTKYTMTPVEYEFTVTKAKRTWTEQDQRRFDVEDSIELTARPTGDGDLEVISSDPAVVTYDPYSRVLIGTGVGTATVTVRAAGSRNYEDSETSFDVKVGWEQPEWSNLDESKTVVYGDPDFSLNPQTTSDGSVSVHVSGSSIAQNEDGTFHIVEPGESTIVYSTPQTDTFYASQKSIAVTVDKRTVTIRANDAEMTYGDPVPELSYQVENALEGEPVKDVFISTVKNPSAGTQTIGLSAKITSNPNYDLKLISGSLCVNPRLVSITWSNQNPVYNGESQLPTPSFSNLVDGDTLSPTISGALTSCGVIGTAEITSLNNPNYTFLENEASCSFEIAKKEVQVYTQNAVKVFGQNDPDLHAALVVDGSIGSDLENTFLVSRAPGESVGDYPLYVTCNPDALLFNPALVNYDIHINSNAKLTIAKKEITPVWSTDPLIYNGSAQTPSVTFEGLEKGDSCEAVIDGAQTHAGTGYTAEIVSLTNPNYSISDTNRSVEFSIDPKAVTVQADSISKTYGDPDPELTFTASGLIGNDRLSSIILSRQSGENTGSYTITASLTEDAAHANSDYALTFETGQLSITPRPISIKWDTETPLIYNGSAQLPAFKSENMIEGDDPGIVCTEGNVHAGSDYQAQILSLNNTNYTLSSESASKIRYSILPKSVAITPDETSKIYGDTDPVFSWHADEIIDGDVLEGIQISRTSGESAGSYTLNVQVDKDLNPDYDIHCKAAPFTIHPKEVFLVWDETPLVYNGKPQVPAMRVEGLLTDDSCTASVTGAKIHAGKKYQAAVESLSNPNYALPTDGSTQKEFSIVPKEISAAVQDAVKTYGDSDPAFTYTINGLVEGDTFDESAIKRTAGEEVGVYEIYIDPDSASHSDYSLTAAAGTLTIRPRELTVKWNDSSLTYNGRSQTPSLTLEGLVHEDICTPSIEGAQIHSGTNYKATLKALDNPNYTFAADQAQTEFSILPASLELTLKDAEKIYGETDPDFEMTLDGWVEEYEPAIEISRQEGEDAGDYPIDAAFSALSDDYKLHITPAKLSILPRSIEELPITLKDLLRENGQIQKQTFEDLTWRDENGIDHPVSYEAENNTQSSGGAYTMTIKGNGNYTGELTQSFVVLPAAGPSFPRSNQTDAQIGKGSLSLLIEADSTLPDVQISTTHEDLLNALADQGLISAMDLAAIADGKNESITLRLKDLSVDYPATAPEGSPAAAVSSSAFALEILHPFGAQDSAPASIEVPVTLALADEMKEEGTVLSLYALEGDQAVPISFAQSDNGQAISFLMKPGQILQLVSVQERHTDIDPDDDSSAQPSTDPSDDSSSSDSSSDSSSSSSSSSTASSASSQSSSKASSKASSAPKKNSSSPSTGAEELPVLVSSFGAALASLLGLIHIGSRNRRRNDSKK